MDTPDKYFLRKRAKHVFTETKRVFDFASECASGGDAVVLGKLMDESQKSCDELFDVSCPELDTLTKLARCSTDVKCIQDLTFIDVLVH